MPSGHGNTSTAKASGRSHGAATRPWTAFSCSFPVDGQLIHQLIHLVILMILDNYPFLDYLPIGALDGATEVGPSCTSGRSLGRQKKKLGEVTSLTDQL